MPLGSIFSVVAPASRSVAERTRSVPEGGEQVAAGYLLYGASTMMVFTSGQGVHGFTLDPGIGEYMLSHEAIAMPAVEKSTRPTRATITNGLRHATVSRLSENG